MEEKKKKVVGRPFKVGNTVGGRTKGSMNKVTKFSREVLTLALAGQEENIRNALEKLSQKNPEAYIGAVAKLLNYAIPKLQATEITANGNTKIEISGAIMTMVMLNEIQVQSLEKLLAGMAITVIELS